MEKKSAKLIINADDFGVTQGVNQAIVELTDSGVVTSTSVMSNMPYCEEIRLLHNRIGIGVHLNLTTGEPILPQESVPSLVDNSGKFYDLHTLLDRTHRKLVSASDVEREFNAQITRLHHMQIPTDHINTHQSLLKYPFFFSMVRKVAKQNKVPAVRIYQARKLTLDRLLVPSRLLKTVYLNYQKMRLKKDGFLAASQFDSLLSLGLTWSSAMHYLRNIFARLWSGVLELAVHPGYVNDEIRDLGSYTHQREVELSALMSEEFRALLVRSRVDLISFSHL